jgi:RimJ/RimL family protein N-acetyltransferase
MQIILESERLLFRPHLITDLDDYCAMEMDINVRRYAGGYPRSREEAERRFPKNQANEVSNRLSLWATVLKAENIYIGRSGLYPHFNSNGRPIPDEAKLAFYLAHKFWGQGFATEAAQAFIHFGWNKLALTRIVASVTEGNDASMHILKKLGFSLTSIEKRQRTFYHFDVTPTP